MDAIVGLLGVLLLVFGVVAFLVAVVPAARRRFPKLVRNASVSTIVGVVLIVVGVAMAGRDDTTTATAATPSPQKSPVAERAPQPAPRAPEPEYVDATTPVAIDKWVIQAGWEGQGVVFRSQLGNEFLGEQADIGYKFALVPVAVMNNTKKTDSLGFVTWTLNDGQDYQYEIETLADIYLGNNMLDVTNIPPGATRSGYLVFQVRDGVRALYLNFEGVRNQKTWRFATQ